MVNISLDLQNVASLNDAEYLVPALEHDVIQGGGAALGGLHPVSVLNLVEDLGICHTWKKRQHNEK